MFVSPLYRGVQSWTQHCRCVSPVLRRGEDALSWPAGSAFLWSSLPQRHNTDLWSICCPPDSPVMFFLKMLSSQLAPYLCSCMRVHLTTYRSFVGFHYDAYVPISLTFQGSSEWQHNHLVGQPLFWILYLVQTWSKCTLFHHSGHAGICNKYYPQYQVPVSSGVYHFKGLAFCSFFFKFNLPRCLSETLALTVILLDLAPM